MRIKYIGGTPGADSNAYTVVDTTQMGVSGVLSNGGANRIIVGIKNSHSGTLKEYRSADKGSTWSQISETSVSAAAATGVNLYEFRVLQFTDWKLEWVNGGSTQTTWAVDIGTIRKPSASATINSPAPGTQFLVGVATTVSGTGQPTALTWATGGGSAGTITYPTGSTWSCEVTATLSDAAETSLVLDGGVDTLACTVGYLPEAYLIDSAVLRIHDAARGATTGGGTITALGEQVSGHADETLAPGGSAPVYNATDADFGGTPSIESTGTEYLVNVGNILISQKFTYVWVGIPPTETAARYLVDGGSGAALSERCVMQTDTTWDMFCGSTASTTAPKDGTQPSLVWWVVDGAATTVRVRTKDGTLTERTVISTTGTNDLLGCCIMASRTGSLSAAQKLRVLMVVDGEPTGDDIARFEAGYWEVQLGADPLP